MDIPIIGVDPAHNEQEIQVVSIEELDKSKFYHIKIKKESLGDPKVIHDFCVAMQNAELKGLITSDQYKFDEITDTLKQLTPEQADEIYNLLYSKAKLVDTVKHEQAK
jgi:hypothetical protein